MWSTTPGKSADSDELWSHGICIYSTSLYRYIVGEETSPGLSPNRGDEFDTPDDTLDGIEGDVVDTEKGEYGDNDDSSKSEGGDK